jgi:FkbM family methyltransferase
LATVVWAAIGRSYRARTRRFPATRASHRASALYADPGQVVVGRIEPHESRYGLPTDGFECFDNWVSRWVCRGILAGETYPQLPIPAEISTVVDVGANCGAASVYFARCYPQAAIHAVEPAGAAFALLQRNAAGLSNIRAHNVGLHRADLVVPLYQGAIDAVTASVLPRARKNAEASEMIRLRNANAWASEHGITNIDLLKLDAEGCEVEILEAFGDLLAQIKVAYIEYDSAAARRRIDHLLDPSHELCQGLMFLDQGEMIYVSRSVLDADASTEPALIEFFRNRLMAATSSVVPEP